MYAVLLLAKLVPNYAVLLCKILAQKSSRVHFLKNFKSGCVIARFGRRGLKTTLA